MYQGVKCFIDKKRPLNKILQYNTIFMYNHSIAIGRFQLYYIQKGKLKINILFNEKRVDNLKRKPTLFLGEEVERMLFVWGRITFSIVIINNSKKIIHKIKKILIYNNDYCLIIIIDFLWYFCYIGINILFFIIIKE